MATRMLPATVQRHHHYPPPRVSKFHHKSSPSPVLTSLVSFYSRNLFASNYYLLTSSSVDCNLRRSFPSSPSNRRTRSGHCRAASPGSPSPPELDPPPGDSRDSSGIMSRFSKMQDAVRIFFAVLFWMSLFFWSCVWDGGNNGRPNKGSQFRK
ncbi:OLC1v1037447C1 [Oldenlandia corymbosa var. corymbosa]|uniref:OLC1v1037447C1 n=1 Tax=Oldenlandia corymbosa var. corymbosa TaxID=529605 RepID=A0AAV1E3G1_OLDCO|nr:OLC1v1037447C1 [Oldenlandia corymbosa var. corymbosa]